MGKMVKWANKYKALGGAMLQSRKVQRVRVSQSKKHSIFPGLGDDEINFYKAHIWVGLDGVNKALEKERVLQVKNQYVQR